MLYRKIANKIEQHLKTSSKIMIVDGARQTGKSYIIRYVGKKLFKNYIELNFEEDFEGPRSFQNVHTLQDFYLQVSMIAGNKMGNADDTIIFLDEIQRYPHFFTLLKFLREDNRFTYIASGSLLGVTLKKTTSIPVGSIQIEQMYPLDFEEFLIANGFGNEAIEALREKYEKSEKFDEATDKRLTDMFRKYLLVGGLPDAVNTYVETNNIVKVREIHRDIMRLYIEDAVKYEKDNRRKLKIRRIYEMIPSNMERQKKRVVVKEIEDKKGKRYDNYTDEFDYLISSGIALGVKAVSTATFPLIEVTGKNLLKLYYNDVGLLTSVLYGNNIRAVLDDEESVNLGSVYETAVAQELKAHGYTLYYYDNKKKGEVDFLIDDYDTSSVIPVEVKSGKDYRIHNAISTFISNADYSVKMGIVLHNGNEMVEKNKVFYCPVYYSMFLSSHEERDVIF